MKTKARPCPRCGERDPAAFNRRSAAHDGLQCWCRACTARLKVRVAKRPRLPAAPGNGAVSEAAYRRALAEMVAAGVVLPGG